MSDTREQFIELVTSVILTFILGFFYKWIWNEVMPYLFGLPTITYWKMVGVVLLANALFGRVLKKN